MKAGQIVVDVTAGPVVSAGLQLLDFADRLFEVVPEWHREERQQLEAESDRLRNVLLDQLKK
jgi:hypothetical protein